MPVAYDIYANQKPAADILGGVERGLKIGDLLRQKNQYDNQKKIGEIVAQNTSTDKDGKIQLNWGNTLSKIAEVSPDNVMSFYNMKQQYDTNQSNLKRQNDLLKLEERKVKEIEKKNIFDRQQANTAANWLKNNLTPAEMDADKAYLKERTEFFNNKTTLVSDIDKLKTTLLDLSKDKSLSGTMFKKASSEKMIKFYDEKAVNIAQDIKSVLYKSLKTTFGSQLSDGERLAMVETAWDYGLPVKDNIKKVQNMILTIEAGMMSKQQMADHYKKYRTISNYEGPQVDIDKLKQSYAKLSNENVLGLQGQLDIPGIKNARAANEDIYINNRKLVNQDVIKEIKANPNSPESKKAMELLGIDSIDMLNKTGSW